MIREGNAIAVNLNAGKTLKLFTKGVYYDKRACLAQKVNHTVTLVGFDRGYWIVRESWMSSLMASKTIENGLDIKIKWRSNFIEDSEGKCICGGHSDECSAMVITRKSTTNNYE